jgi:integrase
MSLTVLPLELTSAYSLRINGRMIKKKQRIKDLPSGVGVTTAVNGSGVKYWRIRLGKRFTGGPIVLKDFRNLDDAREWVTKQRAQAAATGQASYSLTIAQMADARSAFDLLKGKATLATCAKYWLKHAAPSGGVKTWKEISSDFMTSRRAIGCKPKTLVQYESYLRVIGEEWNDVNLSEIKRQDIEDWLAEMDWSGRTRKNYLVTLTTIFSWAMEREYCGENPAKKINRPILDDNAPGILTPIQAEALLQTAKECLPEMVAPIAVGLFAGVRRSELCALDWSEIDLSARHIEIKGIKAKTRQRRLVSISDNLLEWLRPYAQESGPVAPNVDLFGEKLKHLVRGRPKTVDDPGRPAIVAEWPHNALRHSFGSYFFGKSKNENVTAVEMGNSPAMVFKHYRALVKPQEVVRYWAINPADPANLIAFNSK